MILEALIGLMLVIIIFALFAALMPVFCTILAAIWSALSLAVSKTAGAFSGRSTRQHPETNRMRLDKHLE